MPESDQDPFIYDIGAPAKVDYENRQLNVFVGLLNLGEKLLSVEGLHITRLDVLVAGSGEISFRPQQDYPMQICRMVESSEQERPVLRQPVSCLDISYAEEAYSIAVGYDGDFFGEENGYNRYARADFLSFAEVALISIDAKQRKLAQQQLSGL